MHCVLGLKGPWPPPEAVVAPLTARIQQASQRRHFRYMQKVARRVTSCSTPLAFSSISVRGRVVNRPRPLPTSLSAHRTATLRPPWPPLPHDPAIKAVPTLSRSKARQLCSSF
jgi:hypothetical protein